MWNSKGAYSGSAPCRGHGARRKVCFVTSDTAQTAKLKAAESRRCTPKRSIYSDMGSNGVQKARGKQCYIELGGLSRDANERLS